MSFRFIIYFLFVFFISVSVSGQRIGPDIKRDLPDTIYIAGGLDSISISVANFFSDEKRAFDLEFVSPKKLYELVKDPKSVFVLPLKHTTKSGLENYSMAMVSGSENAKLNKINSDGTFPWDFNLPLLVEVHAESSWLSSQMILFYVSALECLQSQAQKLRQRDILALLEEDLSQKRFKRVAIFENTVIVPFRAEGELASQDSRVQMYTSPEELLSNEDIFDNSTIVAFAFEFNGERICACYSFEDGLIYYKDEALDEHRGYLMDFRDLKSFLRFSN